MKHLSKKGRHIVLINIFFKLKCPFLFVYKNFIDNLLKEIY